MGQTLLLALCALFCFAACGESGEKKDDSKPASKSDVEYIQDKGKYKAYRKRQTKVKQVFQETQNMSKVHKSRVKCYAESYQYKGVFKFFIH